MLDVIVLIAMAVTAAAFAAGLTLQADLPLLPVLIGTAALFLVMAASFFSMGRGSRGDGTDGERIAEIEEALEIIDTDLQRLDRVEDGLSRLDGLSGKVERLDQAVAGGALGEGAGKEANAAFAAELEGVYTRIESLRAEIKAENESQRDKIAKDIGAIDGLIKRITGDLAAATAATGAAQAFVSKPDLSKPDLVKSDEPPAPPPLPVVEEDAKEDVVVEPEPEPLLVFEHEPAPEPESESTPEPATAEEPEQEVEILTEEEVVETVPLAVKPEAPEKPKDEPEGESKKDEPKKDATVEATKTPEPKPEPKSEPDNETGIPASALLDDEEAAAEEKMLNTLREGISEGRVDLYLEPTVILPDRKVRYFEAVTRVRTGDDEVVLPGDYIPVAKRAALMPLIDNVLLVRSIQVLRRLGPDTRIRGVFGNVSMHSLLDPDYYPELIEFMEENSSLSENLVFQINQAEMEGLTKSELACLDTLGALGYTFCLDNTSDSDTDFSDLNDYFRHVKVSTASFLGGPSRNAADLKRQLDGLGMQLIISEVENEGNVAELLDHGIELAQGSLFGEPRPMNAALSKELERAGAS